MTKAALTVLHIRDMYLKKFYNEIYAQGRREYLAHVNNEIQKHAFKTFLRFKHKAQKAGVEYKQKEEPCEPQDDPSGIILKEFKNGGHDLIVVGGKRLTGITTIKSKNIPAKLAARIKERALLIIRA
jgi:nucleotide-binding universal stress UspA family protein